MTPSIVKNVVRMPKQRSKQVRTRISYMTSEQLERFLKAAKEYGPREHAMFLFAVAHGARAQEICNLQISDINFGNEQIHIARLKGSLPSTQTLLKVKGNSLFDEKAVLKAWLAVREADADDFVFNSQKSTQMNRVTVFKLFRAIAKKAGFGETLQHPHVLKHTAAMLLVQQGANAFLIRQALGHKSFDSTLAYVNPSDADASVALAKAFNQLGLRVNFGAPGMGRGIGRRSELENQNQNTYRGKGGMCHAPHAGISALRSLNKTYRPHQKHKRAHKH